MNNNFKNYAREVTSPPSHSSYIQKNTTTSFITKKTDGPLEGTRLFNNPNSNSKMFGDVNLAKSGFISTNPLYQSTIFRGGAMNKFGNLSDDRLKKISSDFIKLYGSSGQISAGNAARIQRQAHQRTIIKNQLGQQDAQQLLKVMDFNRDNRVTEDDILSLCRRYLNCQKRPITYTPLVEQRLAVARRLFKQFDVDKKGFLTERQVPLLLTQTYKTLGKAFQATQQDVKSWMRIADGNGDGQVTLPEYERSIIRALKKQGIKIYDE